MDEDLKLLIIRPGALGDTLMLMPSLAQLTGLNEIILVGRSPGLEILRPHIHDCLDFEGQGWHRLFMEKDEKDTSLSIPRVDHVVAFLSDPDAVILKRLKSLFQDAAVHVFPSRPAEEEKTHVALYLARALEQAGIPIDPRRAMQEALVSPLLRRKGPPSRPEGLLFHPGSGGRLKNHPPRFWLSLMRAMRQHFPRKEDRFCLLLGPAEEGVLSFFSEHLYETGAEIIFSPEREELLSLLARASLYLGHDSGITHLASMLGLPTIALFKNSSEHQWRPLGPAVKLIKGNKADSRLLARIMHAALDQQKCHSNKKIIDDRLL